MVSFTRVRVPVTQESQESNVATSTSSPVHDSVVGFQGVSDGKQGQVTVYDGRPRRESASVEINQLADGA